MVLASRSASASSTAPSTARSTVASSGSGASASASASASARAELAGFLRSRRERLTPDRVGLPPGGRRRTPGLRREEVAMLSGIGVTWYTWLEQGRDITPSTQVLDALARALLLDPDERAHLHLLATGSRPDDAGDPAGCSVVTADHVELLARFEGVPACIQTAKFDILAANATYRFLITDIDEGPLEDRSCMVRAFLDPVWRSAYDDWEATTARMVARLRAAMPSHLDDPSWTGLVERMRTSSERFDELWQRHDLTRNGARDQVFHLPRAGDVTVRFTRLHLDEAASVHLNVLQPVGEEDARRLAALAPASVPRVTMRPTLAERLGEELSARDGGRLGEYAV
ncbi:helix-turn-helix transcriptional regulator [Brachybacterium sp. ACRRE]|uniref:helix-turn-helix transcriptional regulator n=1 Tax=Brachybacterium sp. ACRRE TaxID=2918184 RepID=UPI001EF33F67|nr:helix-turn-helix transcriptional regulator [Brachybacterium sp. ACRRE]MCG7310946.1 helix-turn-helix transcriptional regulator [Brachybacterium sp. ACRRE]